VGADHEEVAGPVGGQLHHPLDLVRLAGRAQFLAVAGEQLVDVDQALGVEVLELDFGAFAEPPYDRLAVDPEGDVYVAEWVLGGRLVRLRGNQS